MSQKQHRYAKTVPPLVIWSVISSPAPAPAAMELSSHSEPVITCRLSPQRVSGCIHGPLPVLRYLPIWERKAHTARLYGVVTSSAQHNSKYCPLRGVQFNSPMDQKKHSVGQSLWTTRQGKEIQVSTVIYHRIRGGMMKVGQRPTPDLRYKSRLITAK